jgi:hypothetical protein
MNSDFEPPPKKLSILASIGGVVTAVVAIAGLEALSNHLNKQLPPHGLQYLRLKPLHLSQILKQQILKQQLLPN